MNVYAWLSLSASIVTLLLGITVFSLNKKAMLNKLFLLTALAGFYWTFTEFMMWQSINVEVADFWNHMGFLWPFFVVLVFHFSLLYTKNNLLNKKLTYIVLYAPAVIFAIVDFSTNLINSQPILQYWGYEDTSPATTAYTLSTVWVSILPILALLICLRFYFRTKDENKRQQSKFVTIGFAIPIVAYLLTNIVFPFLNINIPNMGHVATLFFGIFLAYGILKYELFTLDAAMAADNIISTMPDSLVLSDLKGTILKVNNRLLDFLGYQEKELVGNPLTKISSDEGRWKRAIAELKETRELRNLELKCQTKSGEEKCVLFSGSIVKSKTLRDVGFTCIIRDITERKEMEEKLVRAERLASIGELAGQIGHDLRNPLTSIKSGAYFLKAKNVGSDAQSKNILELIDKSVEDSNRIVTSLINYASDLKLQISPCNPKVILLSALSKVKLPESIQLINNLSHETEVWIDAERIETVFVNIIKNAIEAMPRSGTLEIKSIQSGSDIDISFIDSGEGMTEEVRAKIFSPLMTTKAKGMGLGLSICQRIVEAHNGCLFIESVLGKGTTATIRLKL